jgi:TonB-linked SusC/RagA family outer membrane protein
MQKTALRDPSIIKILLVMRLTAFLLTVTFLQAAAAGTAQTVTLSGKDITLKQVFAAIKQQTGYVVFYNQKMLSGTKPVSLTVYNMQLQDLLKLVFKDQPVNYIIQDKTIILSRKTAGEKSTVTAEIPDDHPSVTISGLIRSLEGDYLEGASVRIKNAGTGTTTNNFGGFQLKRVPENAVVEISIIGYETVDFTVVKAGDKFQLTTPGKVSFSTDLHSIPGTILLTLHLKKSLSVLDETQVLAYGKTSRRFSTGSVGTIKGEDIQKQPVMNVLQALEGRVAGLTITPTTGNAAAPVKVEIRGRNSLNPNALSEPLYIVDGVPQGALNVGGVLGSATNLNTGAVQAGLTNTLGESPLLYLNPRDIENISVLKDADATAIYGARGANGVIIINTKRSKPGPTRFTLNVARGKTTIPRKLKLLKTEEYLAMRKEALRNDGVQPDIYNAPDLMLWDQTRYTDWQDYFYAPGEVITVDAGVSGGIAQTNYGIAAGYQSQEELMNQGGKNTRGSFTGNVSHASMNQKFRFGFSTTVAITSVDAIRPGNYAYTAPNAPDVYDQKGNFNFVPYRGMYGSNFPFNALKRPSESRTMTTNNSLQLSYEIVRGLKLSATGGFNFSNNDNAYYTPAASADALFGNLSIAYFGKSSTVNLLVEPQISYKTFIGRGSLSVQLGGSLQQIKNEGITTIGIMFPNDNLMRSPNNASVKQVIEGSGEYKYAAAFAIINYSWDNKYILDLNARRDGSSKFGPGRQFGNFWSVGAIWIASQEKWIQSILPSWWSFVKLSGSYGITGSDAVGDYEFLTRWGNVPGNVPSQTLFDYNGTPGFHLLGPVNQDFRWESTNKLNLSVAFGFLKDRVNVSADYYRHRSGNQLTQMPTPVYTGFEHVRANSPALVQNSGIEINIDAKILNTKDWHLSANFNFSRNRNKLVDYPGLASSPYAYMYEIGQSLNAKYLYHYTGINPATGDYTFEDRNKNGNLSTYNAGVPRFPDDDRYIVYDLNPDYTGGFAVQASWKGVGLAAQFVYKKQWGEDPYVDLQIGTMKNVYIPKEVAENHWQKPGDLALYPKYTSLPLNQTIRSSDRYYTDASFVKLGTLALSYDLPAGLLNKVKVQSCRFLVSTQNVFTITSYRGLSPEIRNFNGSPVTRNIQSSLMFTF